MNHTIHLESINFNDQGPRLQVREKYQHYNRNRVIEQGRQTTNENQMRYLRTKTVEDKPDLASQSSQNKIQESLFQSPIIDVVGNSPDKSNRLRRGRPISQSAYVKTENHSAEKRITHQSRETNSSVHIQRCVTTIRAKNKFKSLSRSKLNSQRGDQMIACFKKREIDLFMSIQRKDLQGVIDASMQLLEDSIDQCQIQFFAQIVNFVGLFCSDMGENDKAAFFFHQFKIVADTSVLLKEKGQSLINLATIATKIQLFEQSIRLLKKALQYSWKVNNLEQELQIYELIGVNYYYLGEIQNAKFYHNKSVRADNEIEDSPLRQISIAIIDRQLKNPEMTHIFEFNRLYLFRLSLPIINRYDQDQIRCDTFKSTSYTNAKADHIIKTISEENEFISFELDQPVYSRLRELSNHRPLKKNEEEVDFSFVEHKSRLYTRMPKFHGVFSQEIEKKLSLRKMPISIDEQPNAFKIPVERQLLTRQKDFMTTETRLSRIHSKIKHGYNLHQRQKVQINHMTDQKINKTRSNSTEPKVLVRKYKLYFEQIILQLQH